MGGLVRCPNTYFNQTGRTTLGNERIDSIESMGSIPIAVLAVVWLLFAGWSAGRLLRVMLRDSQVFDVSREIVYVVAGLHLVALFGVSLGMTGLLVGSRTLILLGMFSLLGIAEAWPCVGIGIGIGCTVASGSFARIIKGINGGILGGLLAGIFHSVVAAIFFSGSSAFEFVPENLTERIVWAAICGLSICYGLVFLLVNRSSQPQPTRSESIS